MQHPIYYYIFRPFLDIHTVYIYLLYTGRLQITSAKTTKNIHGLIKCKNRNTLLLVIYFKLNIPHFALLWNKKFNSKSIDEGYPPIPLTDSLYV